MHSTVTVTSAAADYDLVDLLDVKEELDITDTTDDSKLQRWITAASARFASACGRSFAAQTYTEIYRADFCERMFTLLASKRPVISITSITDSGLTLSASDYELDSEVGQFYRLSGSTRSWWGSNVTVVYRAGYAVIPADVSDAVMSLMRYRWFTAGQNTATLKSFSIEGVGREDYWTPLTTGSGGGDLPLELQPVRDTIQAYSAAVLA